MNTPEELIPVIDWWQKDGKKTIAVVACAGLVALAINFFISRNKRLDVEASAYAYGNGNYSVQQLQDAVVTYAGCDVAGMIKLRLAKMYFADGEFEKALEVYTELVNEKSMPKAFALAPELGVARSNEALNKWADAKVAYDSIISSDKANSLLLFDAKLGVARCVAFGGARDEAIKTLEALKSSSAGDQGVLDLIEQNIDAIKRWQKREKPLPAPVVVDKVEPKVETKADVKASDLTLPSAAPKSPVKESAAPQSQKSK